MDLKEQIDQWFEDGADFDTGVAIYKSLPRPKSTIIRSFSRGKNSYNKSLLIKELRVFKTVKPLPEKKASVQKIKENVQRPATDRVVQQEQLQETQKKKSAERFFQRITYASLPPELKPRYREVRDLFYDMCDLKFILNDIEEVVSPQALAIQLQIDELDTQRALIWKELEHWDKHKTFLPSGTEDFSKLPEKDLYKTKANLVSKIAKLSKRIELKYDRLEDCTDRSESLKIEATINRSEKLLHQHNLNLVKIEELL